MPRMQDTAEEPSPSPSTRAGVYGMATLGAEAAWPKPGPVPASHPTTVTVKGAIFVSLSLLFSPAGDFPRLPHLFPSQHHGAAPGCRAVSLCSSVPLATLSPCSTMSLSSVSFQ